VQHQKENAGLFADALLQAKSSLQH